MEKLNLIDANNFREELNEGRVRNFSVVDDLFFSRRNGGDMTSLINCKFEKTVRLEGIEAENALLFEGCRFQGNVMILNAEFKKGLTFKNCKFTGEVTIKGCNFNNQLTFLDSEFDSKLQISSISMELMNFNGGKFAETRLHGNFNVQKDLGCINFMDGNFGFVQIKAAEYNADLVLTGGEFERFHVTETKINGEIRIAGKGLSLASLVFFSCKLLSRIDIKACIISRFLQFVKVSCMAELTIQENVLVEFIDFNEVTAVERVKIAYQDNFTMLTLKDCDFKTSFECNSLVLEYVELTSSFSAKLQGILRGSIIFWDIPIDEIYLGCSNFGNLTFRDINTDQIIMNGFQNQNKVTFFNIEVNPGESNLTIVDSELDKTHFLNLDFSQFSEIVVVKSDVSSVSFSNCELPSNILLGSSDPSKGYGIKNFERVNRAGYHRENYRQLKMALEKQGNRHAALRYKAKEMYYLRKESKWGRDKMLLYLNFLSNNHGLSWTRGLLFTVIAMSALFCWYQATLPAPTYTLHSFFNYASSFPLYKTQSEGALNWMTYLVIMLSRIVIGYGIYQFISAFRKFGGK